MIHFEPHHFEDIKKFAWEFAGIVIDRVPKKGVFERIRTHIEKLHLTEGEEYLRLLKNLGSSKVRDEFMALVTVNESYFFRNPVQFKFLAHDILPGLCRQRHLQQIHRIYLWSAGCATGEEAYSLAYICDWYRRRHPDFLFQIMGSDINVSSLEKAKEGSFRKRSVRPNMTQIIEEFREPFIREIGETWQVEAGLKELVTFQAANLRETDRFKFFPRPDIIFCRNVMIYFDDRFRQDLIAAFLEVLNPGGFLLLGETESLPKVPEKLELVNCQGAFCYRKVLSQEGTSHGK